EIAAEEASAMEVHDERPWPRRARWNVETRGDGARSRRDRDLGNLRHGLGRSLHLDRVPVLLPDGGHLLAELLRREMLHLLLQPGGDRRLDPRGRTGGGGLLRRCRAQEDQEGKEKGEPNHPHLRLPACPVVRATPWLHVTSLQHVGCIRRRATRL